MSNPIEKMVNKIMFLTMVYGLFFIAAGNVSAQTCQPNDNQIAIFAEKNFQGKCKVLNIGEYPNLKAIGFENDNIFSMKIGKNVKVTSATLPNGGGTQRTHEFDNNYLEDLYIGDNNPLPFIRSLFIYKDDSKSAGSGSPVTGELQKNMIETWVQNDQKMTVTKEEFKVYKNGKLFFSSSYRLIAEDVMEFIGTEGKASQRKVSFKDNGKTMVWENPAKNTSSEFTPVLKSSKPAANEELARAGRIIVSTSSSVWHLENE